ncbi:MAG: LacI family transcriptional regulator [Alicyclobacillus macrosporangiidus]|uniref:LacI family DNA-binding transcriptional regulator n=1 Tax=Alicyclobacillus macrosporangiidus TaxID=392015 RepID=UPI0026F32B0D|nr:LacI family DNA-binding transcriptional regulator [Alicyclobacillus macrosporangiidus]MCL6598030.1 LacI family transcriptional regulator [Alicyclobacillus macrosporangiidus]
MRVTIRDVAKHAGVSPATVSRVLNRPELVDQATREKVRRAMDDLDFQPSAAARGLSVRRTDTIGLIVPGITNLFFNELYAGIEQAASRHGRKVLMFNTENSAHRVLDAFSFMRQHEVDGILYTSETLDENADPLLQRIGIPVVLALTESLARTPLSAYKVDERRAVFDAVAYLVTRGHRRIGFLGGQMPHDITGQQRYEGFLQAVRHFGLESGEAYVEFGDYRMDSGYTAMQRLLERQSELRLTAIAAASDEMALGAIRCLNDRGFRVPDDMSVMGFDNLQIASMLTPRLTTVAQPFREIGARAVERLVELTENPNLSSAEHGVHYLPHHIVERESVRPILDGLDSPR